MDFEKPCCPVVEVDGAVACGKQFDLDISLPCDNRNVIFGVIKDCFKEPVKDAVVKLIEIVCECGKEERRPVSHTFTDDEGEFVFGPLCPDKKYEIDFWADQVKHVKVCARCAHEGKCLKGVKMDKCDCFVGGKPCCKCDCKKDCCWMKDCDKDDCCCEKDHDKDECKKECWCKKECDKHDDKKECWCKEDCDKHDDKKECWCKEDCDKHDDKKDCWCKEDCDKHDDKKDCWCKEDCDKHDDKKDCWCKEEHDKHDDKKDDCCKKDCDKDDCCKKEHDKDDCKKDNCCEKDFCKKCCCKKDFCCCKKNCCR